MHSINEADNAFREDRFADALKLYDQVINEQPNNALAYQGAADCCLNLREFQGALDFCSKALELDSSLLKAQRPNGKLTHLLTSLAIAYLYPTR